MSWAKYGPKKMKARHLLLFLATYILSLLNDVSSSEFASTTLLQNFLIKSSLFSVTTNIRDSILFITPSSSLKRENQRLVWANLWIWKALNKIFFTEKINVIVFQWHFCIKEESGKATWWFLAQYAGFTFTLYFQAFLHVVVSGSILEISWELGACGSQHDHLRIMRFFTSLKLATTKTRARNWQ